MWVQLVIKAAITFLISIKDLSGRCLPIPHIFRIRNLQLSLPQKFLSFLWSLRDTRRWRCFYHRASDEELRKLKRSVRERDADVFGTLVIKFADKGQLESAVFEMNFRNTSRKGRNKNLLEEILSMPEEDAEVFYSAIQENISDQTFNHLIKHANHPRYVSQNPELLDRILADCHKTSSGITLFCSAQGNCGETVLHAAVRRDIRLFQQFIQGLEYLINLNRIWDFMLIVSALNIFAILVMIDVPVDYIIAFVVQLTAFMLHHFLYSYDLVWLLQNKDQSGESVFEVVAQIDKRSFQICVDIINAQTSFNASSFLIYLFRKYAQLFRRVSIGGNKGRRCAFLIYILVRIYQLLCVALYGKSVMWMYTIPFNLEDFIEICITAVLLISVNFLSIEGELFEPLLLDWIPIRLIAHILYIPWRGVLVCLGLIGCNIASSIGIILYWRYRCRTLVETELFYNYSETRIGSVYLTKARADVTLAVLDEILRKNEGFVYENTLKVLRIPDVYRYLACDRKDGLTIHSIDDSRRIKDKLKLISKMEDDHINNVTDCCRVHVVVLSAMNDRIDAGKELESINVMCEEMNYTLHPMDVSDGDDFQLMLEGTLSKITDADLVLVFIMGHGRDDEIFGYSGTGIHISKIIEVVSANLPEDMSKSLYVQTCRTVTGQDAEHPILASDPISETISLPETVLVASDSIYKCLEGSKNMLVHTATKEGSVAIQDTFVSLIADELRCKNKLLICLYEASVATTNRCRAFSDCQLYQSPNMDRMCKIRVPP